MSKVSDSYDGQANAYDDFINKLVPDYAVFHDLLTIFLEPAETVLDIGCGTGNTSLHLLQKAPYLQLTCMDASSMMLEITKKKLGDQHVYVESSVENYDFAKRYDAVVSVMVMHNIQATADRLETYKKIFNSLKDVGTYITVDIFEGETSQTHNTYMACWREFMMENLPESEVGKWLKVHKEKDRPLKLSEQMRLLGEAGFATVEIVHKRLQFAMMIARK